MGQRTTYKPGTFSWVELRTPDPAGAVSFYAGVLGWTADATTFRAGRFAVAGLRAARNGEAAWQSFITVADVDAVAARARDLGGCVVAEPADHERAGRQAVVADPRGARVALAQAESGTGAECVNDIGCLCMNELLAPDLEGAARYYADLFGWAADTSAVADGGPLMFLNDGRENAAAFEAPDGIPPHWRPCFTVDDTAAAAERIGRHGGEMIVEPLTFPDGHGSIAVAVDPQGAPFSIFAGQTHP